MSITQPGQNFPLNYGRPGYVLAAGGIGITALVGMGKALRARGANYRFVYGARTCILMAFLDELTHTTATAWTCASTTRTPA